MTARRSAATPRLRLPQDLAATPHLDQVTRLLELVATQQPDLLFLVIDMASHSPFRFAILELASTFGTTPERLASVLHTTCLNLDRLEARRKWKHPYDVLPQANLRGLLYLCRARRIRVSAVTRSRRLAMIARKLEQAYRSERTQRWIEDFLG